MSMAKTVQAKHLSDLDVLKFIDEESKTPWGGAPALPPGDTRWVFTCEVQDRFTEFPAKVVLAKCSALIKRKLIDGCTCGCRGDFELTAKGREVLAAASHRESAVAVA